MKTNFDAKTPTVVRASLPGEDVLRLASATGLKKLLQGRLEIAGSAREGSAIGERFVQEGQGWLDYLVGDKALGDSETSVKIERGNHCLDGVRQQSGLLTAAARLFAATETQVGAEVHRCCDFREVAATNKGGAEPGEFAFVRTGKAPDEVLRHDEPEDSVAEELELLIVCRRIVSGVGGAFVCVGAMGESALEQSWVSKDVTK